MIAHVIHGDTDPYLRKTHYCDIAHPAIRELADRLRAAHGENDRELAVAAFYFVRDRVKWEPGVWRQKASRTLRLGIGSCTNSANLMVAVLRAAGVPAGFGVMSVRGQVYLGPLVPPRLQRHISRTSKHIHAYVLLGGAWLRCDPCYDREIAAATNHLSPLSAAVEWDGTRDAMLDIDPDHILATTGPAADIDPIIRKRRRAKILLGRPLAHQFTRFLREAGPELQNPSELDPEFVNWLKGPKYFHRLYYRSLPMPGRAEKRHRDGVTGPGDLTRCG